jgi:hypothetical protein
MNRAKEIRIVISFVLMCAVSCLLLAFFLTPHASMLIGMCAYYVFMAAILDYNVVS